MLAVELVRSKHSKEPCLPSDDLCVDFTPSAGSKVFGCASKAIK